MRSFAVGQVVQSKADALPKGTYVTGTMGWTELCVVDANSVRPVQEIPGHNLSIYVGQSEHL